jgi:hypothetical protein
MPMLKKNCSSCHRETWHNPSGKKDGTQPRCTFCGHPVSTNIAKREQQEHVRKAQALKPIR